MRSLLLSMLLLVACGTSAGTPTGATCSQSAVPPPTYDTFGRNFMTTYCTGCHSSELQGASRHGAPDDDNFDTLPNVMAGASGIDGVAGSGPNATNTDMPPVECSKCKKPTVEERAQLASWLACEQQAGH